MAKKKSLPRRIQVGRDVYVLTVLVVRSRKEGTLQQLENVREEDIVRLSRILEDNEFITAYVPKRSLHKSPRIYDENTEPEG